MRALVHAVELPAGQADQAVAAGGFALFQDFQRGEDADLGDIMAGEQGVVFAPFAVQDDVVHDEVIALPRHGGDRVAHAAHRALAGRAGADGDDRGARLWQSFEVEAVCAADALGGKHVEEGVHLDVQEDVPRLSLERAGERGFTRAADAVEDDDAGHLGPCEGEVESSFCEQKEAKKLFIHLPDVGRWANG